jgi:hypothetical protein
MQGVTQRWSFEWEVRCSVRLPTEASAGSTLDDLAGAAGTAAVRPEWSWGPCRVGSGACRAAAAWRKTAVWAPATSPALHSVR